MIAPFILLMLFVTYSYRKIKQYHLVNQLKTKEFRSEQLQPIFWIYTAFTFFCTLGFVNFSIIGYHLKANNLLSDGNITLLYSGAMAVDAIAALIVGKIYDSKKEEAGTKTGGLTILMGIPFITLLLPFLTMSHSTIMIILGMVIFGIVMGTHETIMRSAVADITPFYKRGTSFGVFNTGYGLALLVGSAFMGKLYDLNQVNMIFAFTAAAEAIAVLIYLKMAKMAKA